MCDNLPTDLVEEYQKAFQILDRKNVGKISLRDLAVVSGSIGIQLTTEDLANVARNIVCIEHCDLMRPCLDFQVFLRSMLAVLTDCISDDEIRRIFREFDKDGDGFISPQELRALLLRLGDDVTESEIQEMMSLADKDGDGLVSLCEFVDVMTSPSVMTSQARCDCVIERNACSRQASLMYVTSSHKRVTSPKPRRRRKSLLGWMKGVTSSNNDVTKCEEKKVLPTTLNAIRKTLTF